MNDDGSWLKTKTAGDWKFAGWIVALMSLGLLVMWWLTGFAHAGCHHRHHSKWEVSVSSGVILRI